MLLKQLLEAPKNSTKLVVFDPFGEFSREELVKEVIGLANAAVDGPRNILFGVNAGSVNGNGIVGIPEGTAVELKKAHRLVSSLVQPALQLAFIYDMINGKLVGTLEIDGCEFGPYCVGQDYSESLAIGECWIREGRTLHAVKRAELMNGAQSDQADEPAALIENPDIVVGFNNELECTQLELDVPDTSNPPFAGEQSDTKKTSRLKQVIKDTVGTVTTQILRLGQRGETQSTAVSKVDSRADGCDDAGKVFADAENHYYYEERALQINLCVCNKGRQEINEVYFELGFPRLPDFDVADRLYTSPFDKRSPAEIENLGYPEVERRKRAIFARSTIGVLAPDRPEQAFRCALRLAVGPGMHGRKLAASYKIRGPNNQKLGEGRLKIKFGPVPS